MPRLRRPARTTDTTPVRTPSAGEIVEEPRGTAASVRVGLSAGFGLLPGVPVGALAGVAFGTLVTWDVAIVAYIASIWAKSWGLDADRTARISVREDPTRATADLLLLAAAVASLAAVAVVLANARGGSDQPLRIALGLTSVVLSWALVHTVFAVRYARLFYTGPDGGIDFNQPEPPTYRDFAYLAFTIGMTFQVSDTALQAADIRTVALQHALLSYLFGTGVLATTVNLVASLTSQ
jgi:uncharacterized membrane protein